MQLSMKWGRRGREARNRRPTPWSRRPRLPSVPHESERTYERAHRWRRNPRQSTKPVWTRSPVIVPLPICRSWRCGVVRGSRPRLRSPGQEIAKHGSSRFRPQRSLGCNGPPWHSPWPCCFEIARAALSPQRLINLSALALANPSPSWNTDMRCADIKTARELAAGSAPGRAHPQPSVPWGPGPVSDRGVCSPMASSRVPRAEALG